MSTLPIEVQLKTLPDSPGVYQFFDADGKFLYVGKAKSLKKRVSSYFTKSHQNGKTRVMVRKIRKIKHIVVPTESDALLLENNLIKEHRPRYNVRLKDDKRWKYGVPPLGNANYAWIQHFIHHLAYDGRAGFVLANGSMSTQTGGEGVAAAYLEGMQVEGIGEPVSFQNLHRRV